MIEAGKHVLIEKPLTTDVAEAREIVAAAERRGVKLMVDFQLRWHPNYMGAKAAMESGELGRPVMGYARLSDTIHVPTEMLVLGRRLRPGMVPVPAYHGRHPLDPRQEPKEVYAQGPQGGAEGDLGIDA